MDISGEDLDNGMNYVGFNQDHGCFACGMQNGFRIYNCDPLKQKERQEFPGSNLKHVEMLFRCNYLALVGKGTSSTHPSSKVTIWDDLRKKEVLELNFLTEIMGVRLRRDRIVVVLENSIKVYTFTPHPQQMNIFETAPNSKGLCILCPNGQDGLLAYPHTTVGNVELVDLAKPAKDPLVIRAHDSALSCIDNHRKEHFLNPCVWMYESPLRISPQSAMNRCGTRLATASEKGTLIRIFESANGNQLNELRRGASPANINCLNFSSDSQMICASSNRGTIHVFYVEPEQNSRNKQSSLASASFISKYFGSCWGFNKIEIPGGSQCICAFTQSGNGIIAICADGSYYKFQLPERGDPKLELSCHFLSLNAE